MPRPKVSDGEHDEFYSQVGNNVRRARERRGLTQQALATKVPITRSSIANIERGKQKLMVHTVVQLASALEVSVADLVPAPAPASATAIGRLLEAHSPPERKWVEAVVAREARTGR